MADSVALLFAANLATIGGHVAEMISIFVYPVIGYFWTRRRRRSPAMDFNFAEDSPRSMTLVEDSIDALAKCISHLVAILQALERLTGDQDLSKISKGRQRLDELMQEHRELQQDVLALTKKLSDKTMRSDDTVARHTTFDISQSIRLLQLKEEMLALEVQQSKIIFRDDHSKYIEGVDLESGIAEPPPVFRIAEAALRLEESVQPVTPESSQHVALHSCSPPSQWLLEKLSPAREQLLQEMVPDADSSRATPQAEQSSTPKTLLRYGKKRRINAWHPPDVSSSES